VVAVGIGVTVTMIGTDAVIAELTESVPVKVSS
jgi:hypothetical protein